jgi:hypothetical protein
MIRRFNRRRVRVDAFLSAYAQWRAECDAVRVAYRAWMAASASGESRAFHAYRTALDREQRAAEVYAGLVSRAGDLAETGLARQLAWMHSIPGAW